MADRSVEAAELTAAVAVLDYFASLHRMVLRLFSYASPVRVPPASYPLCWDDNNNNLSFVSGQKIRSLHGGFSLQSEVTRAKLGRLEESRHLVVLTFGGSH